jgi:uncharacterized membrane protein YidH (DUF202 family)
MRTQTVVGVLLVLVGVLILVFGGFTYTTTREAIKVGPVGITTQEKKSFPIPPAVGAVLVAGGIVLLIARGNARP